MTSEEKNLLPLGTAVRIPDDESVYIIISRGFQKQDDGHLLAGYQMVPHPFGRNDRYCMVTQSEEEILEVLCRGYEDALDTTFTQERRDEAMKRVRKKAKVAESSVQEGKSEADSKEEEQPKNPYDPFEGLRKRGKRSV